MAEAYKTLYQGVAATPATTVYTVPSLTSTIVKSMRIVNTSGAAVTIKLWQSGSADANVILPEVSVDAGGFAEFDGTLTLAAGTLVAQASTPTAITLTIYGLEIT